MLGSSGDNPTVGRPPTVLIYQLMLVSGLVKAVPLCTKMRSLGLERERQGPEATRELTAEAGTENTSPDTSREACLPSHRQSLAQRGQRRGGAVAGATWTRSW